MEVLTWPSLGHGLFVGINLKHPESVGIGMARRKLVGIWPESERRGGISPDSGACLVMVGLKFTSCQPFS
jgi:hypothetical protein